MSLFNHSLSSGRKLHLPVRNQRFAFSEGDLAHRVTEVGFNASALDVKTEGAFIAVIVRETDCRRKNAG